MTREHRLVATFVELADSLVEDFDVVDLMVLLTERCVELLDVAAAGLLLADHDGTLQLMAATSEAAQAVVVLQVRNDEGPCRDSFRSGGEDSTADLVAAADRWPRFAPAAVAAGFRAAQAVPLRLRGQVLGALNLFRTEPVALTAADVAVARALADVATIGLLQNRAVRDSRLVSEQLQEALNSRVAIEQAKGIVAERLGCGIDDAFTSLRRVARRRRRRLVEVAQGVIEGTLMPEELCGSRR